MKKNSLIFSLLCLAAALSAQVLSKPVEHGANGPDARLDYINRNAQLAIREMDRAGVPASITLAQAILESNAGQSTLAVQANNHFGIKCGNDWTGKTVTQHDDERDAQGRVVESCFRKYKTVDASYADHSDFLRDPKKTSRYGYLFRLNREDYRSWAYGLQSAGYSTSDIYAETLITVIERYHLDGFDRGGVANVPGGNPNTGQPGVGEAGIGRVNDVKVILAREGQTVDEIASIYRLDAAKLIEFNDGTIARSDHLPANTRVFIAKKKCSWHGKEKFHYVRDNQTLAQISQFYGIELANLYKGNKMVAGEEPANGEQVRLRGFFWKKGPRPKIRDANDPTQGQLQPPISNPNPNPNDPGAVKVKDNSPTSPTNDELFEMGQGQVNNRPDGGLQPPPAHRPSTTGTPLPPDPVPGNSSGTYPNDDYRMPPPATRPGPPVRPAPNQQGQLQPGQPGTHTVAKGDTLYNISKRYNTTVQRIKSMNNLPDDNIRIGQVLQVN